MKKTNGSITNFLILIAFLIFYSDVKATELSDYRKLKDVRPILPPNEISELARDFIGKKLDIKRENLKLIKLSFDYVELGDNQEIEYKGKWFIVFIDTSPNRIDEHSINLIGSNTEKPTFSYTPPL